MNKLESLSEVSKSLCRTSDIKPFGCCWCIQEINAEKGYYKLPTGNYHVDCHEWMIREENKKVSA